MKAGRELDVKIGTELFGLMFWHGDPTGYDIEENIDYWIADSESDYGGELSLRCPFYSTQIADAWLVVEKLEGFRPDVGLYDHGWVCTFYGDVVCSADAPTAPLAICLAALKAVKIGVDNEE